VLEEGGREPCGTTIDLAEQLLSRGSPYGPYGGAGGQWRGHGKDERMPKGPGGSAATQWKLIWRSCIHKGGL
jgi:hypothetical protein